MDVDTEAAVWTDRARVAALLLLAAATAFLLESRPTKDFLSLFLFWPHLGCALAFGVLARGLTPYATAPVASLLSCAVILAVFGRIALAVNVVQAAAIYATVRGTSQWALWRYASCVALVLFAGGYACWYLRSLPAIGLWVFAILRYISFAVDVRKGARADLTSFALYSLYYPALLQTEQYKDFTAKNIDTAWRPDYPRAVRRMAFGWVKITAALAIPYTFNDAMAMQSFAGGWGLLLAVYLRAVLFITGAYDTLQAVVSLHGTEIRENFAGVLLADGPSAFWRRWRSTMTEFFIAYVYVPLGGRERRILGVLAVFSCSVLWHWVGVPFFGGNHFNPHYVPALAFGIWNALVLILLSPKLWSRIDGRRDEHERAVFFEARVLATAMFGSVTVHLLAFTPNNAHRAIDNLCVLFPFLSYVLG